MKKAIVVLVGLKVIIVEEDTTAPTVLSMTVESAAPTDVVIVFDEVVTGNNAGFTIAGTTSNSFVSISGSGSNIITGVLADAVEVGQSPTLAYNSGPGDIKDASNNDLVTFNATLIDNNVVNEPVASSVLVAENAGIYSLSYNYAGPETEANKPPFIDEVDISSSGSPGFADGDTLSLTLSGFEAFDGESAGTHLYQWYKSSDNQDTGLASIGGATSSTYLLVTADIGDFIYCKVTPVQTGIGENSQGTPVKSFYTKVIIA